MKAYWEELCEKLQRYQVLVLVGARGTGKCEAVRYIQNRWNDSGVQVISVDARSSGSFEELIAPLVEADPELSIECLPEDLAVTRESKMIFIVENFDYLYDKAWLASTQDRLRAIFTSEGVKGRWNLVLTGRPSLRGLLGGAGSPLANAGVVLTTRPLDEASIGSRYRVAPEVARFLLKQTGGHVGLTDRLATFADQKGSEAKSQLQTFLEENRDYVDRVIADHEELGVRILKEVCASDKRCVQVDSIVQRQYRSDVRRLRGCLDDLLGSGLLAKEDRYLKMGSFLATKVLDESRVRVIEFPEPECHAEACKLLYRAENHFRLLVQQRLAALDDDWWSEWIPEKTASKAERTRSEDEDDMRQHAREPLFHFDLPGRLEETKGPDQDDRDLLGGSLHPLFYLDFPTLFEIARDRDLWSKTFAIEFAGARPGGVDLEWFRRLEKRMLRIRNRAAHNRPVTDHDIMALREFVQIVQQDASPTG